jgi:hypothetical protein
MILGVNVPPHEARGFVHKRLLKLATRVVPLAASFIPVGSTVSRAVSTARSFLAKENGPTRPPSRTRRTRRPSTPPRNPVREAVIRFKPVPPLTRMPVLRRRIPRVMPVPKPHVAIMPLSPRAARAAQGVLPTFGPLGTACPPSHPVWSSKSGGGFGLCFPATLTVRTKAIAAPRPISLPPIARTVMPIHRRTLSALPCLIPGQRRDPNTGDCSFFIGEQPGPDDSPIGDPVMGRYGAGYMPGSQIVDRAVCLPGDVVGDDGLCYPRRSLKNDQRAWPRGRRPLLTGGEMRAISIAHRAAGRLTRTAVRLQDIGLIKKPVARKPSKRSKH